MARIESEYGPCVDGVDPTAMYIVKLDERPFAMIQSYWVHDYPAHAESIDIPKTVGIDYLIGEVDLVGKGLAADFITQFVNEVIIPNYPGASGIVSDPNIDNPASIRTLEKAGFLKGRIVPGEAGLEQIMFRPSPKPQS